MDQFAEQTIDEYADREYDSAKYKSFKTEYNEFDALFESYIRDLNVRKAISSVVLKSSSWNIDLLKSEQREKHFKDNVDKKGESVVQSLGYWRAPIQSQNWYDYLRHKSTKNKKKLERLIQAETWKRVKGDFFEWLIALLTIIHFGENKNHGSGAISLGHKEALPIKINDDDAYLWYQATIKRDASFDAKPDFLITPTRELPEQDDPVKGIIECKAAKGQVGARGIRDIFGKGWDLNPDFILVLCYDSIDQRTKNNVAHYGIDIFSPFNVDTMKNGSLYKTRLEDAMWRRSFFEKIRQKHDMKSGLRLNEV